jgi:hypothetical protein
MISTGLAERFGISTRFVCSLMALAAGGQIGSNFRVADHRGRSVRSALRRCREVIVQARRRVSMCLFPLVRLLG